MPKDKVATAHFKTVDDYIDSFPQPVRPILERIRTIIRKALPKTEESISYNMPTYKMNGEPILYFAGWKKHYSLYPISKRVAEAFATELASHEVNKSTVRFPLSDPIPTKLIASISKFRAKEVAEREKAKSTRSR
jgi:uncharacterized protein YdhG (YjbR/CyaY superfamily)